MSRKVDPYIQKLYNARAYEKNKEQVKQSRREKYKQASLFASAPAPCTCGDFTHCIPCRNAEKRAAFRQGRVPAYRLAIIERIMS